MERLTRHSDGILLRGLCDFSPLQYPDQSSHEEKRLFGFYDGLEQRTLNNPHEFLWGLDLDYLEGHSKGIIELRNEKQISQG